MQQGIPSRTALGVAMRRAAHQLYDRPTVFPDPVAVPILGERYLALLQERMAQPEPLFSIVMRAFIVVRSRYAEDLLAASVAGGLRQYVLLGAGLDTFAYRNPYPHLRVFEVDHPATQQWKQGLLDEAGIPVPTSARMVPVDFESQSLERELAGAGFDRGAPAFFAWLGVAPYLTEPAFAQTLRFIASCAPSSGFVCDFAQPRAALPTIEQTFHDQLGARVRAAGEPFNLYFTPQEMAAHLHAFPAIEQLGAEELNARYFANRGDALQLMGAAGRLVSAWR